MLSTVPGDALEVDIKIILEPAVTGDLFLECGLAAESLFPTIPPDEDAPVKAENTGINKQLF